MNPSAESLAVAVNALNAAHAVIAAHTAASKALQEAREAFILPKGRLFQYKLAAYDVSCFHTNHQTIPPKAVGKLVIARQILPPLPLPQNNEEIHYSLAPMRVVHGWQVIAQTHRPVPQIALGKQALLSERLTTISAHAVHELARRRAILDPTILRLTHPQ